MAEDQKVVETKPEVVEATPEVAKVQAAPPPPPPPPAPPKAKPGRKSSDRPFRATVRIEYPTDAGMIAVLPGEVATGIPSDTIKPWLAQGIIEEVTN